MLIIIITRIDHHLQKPMYFFISNLSCVDILFGIIILPNVMILILSHKNTISFYGCITQMYFFLCIGVTESILLAVMSYDRYVAICNPLKYTVIMTRDVCFYLAFSCWIGGFLIVFLPVFVISQLKYCSNIINHFFCEMFPVIQLSCSDIYWLQVSFTILASVVIFGTFPIIGMSYLNILWNILSLQSLNSKKKTFSTCATHLIVVFMYYSTITFMYIRPKSESNLELDKIISVFYSVLNPILNPLIYSLRNNEIKKALRKCMHLKI
ncbi:olfactory receptor 6C75-like [Rana temporaria]|uniref:olfactory receptor 6C75-like n=1 Tax=Rana temporaria TaxID=8407 RepID=UPI001AAC7D73|nr:olfactory receptor 6C75-like [Rana temporaria]